MWIVTSMHIHTWKSCMHYQLLYMSIMLSFLLWNFSRWKRFAYLMAIFANFVALLKSLMANIPVSNLAGILPIKKNTRVLSGVEVRSQSWWSCKNRSAAAIMLCFRLWKNDLTTIRSSYFTRLSQIWPPPTWLSCCHHHRTTLDIPLEKNCTLSLLLKNRPPSLVFCHARLFFGIAYRQNCRRAPLLARLSQL